jgi:hypothetical protein
MSCFAGAPPPLPMFTSCCPAWVTLVETEYPELIPHLSSCKSPQQMLGATVKAVWCKRNNLQVRQACTHTVFDMLAATLACSMVHCVLFAVCGTMLGATLKAVWCKANSLQVR